MRFLIVVTVLSAFGFASPVFMQDEPADTTEAPAAEAAPDIAATVQVAVAGTVSAWLTAQPTVAPTATATPPAMLPITLTGKGGLNTLPFSLGGGNYSVDWKAVDQPASFGCFYGGTLKAVDGSLTAPLNFASVGSGKVEKGKSLTGTTQLYNVKPNTYYLDMSSSCDWSVTISTQR